MSASGAGDDDVANLQALRVKDVALLAVNVVQQSDAGRAVGIVLDGCNLGGHAVLVALEVDDAVTALVAAALVTGGDAAVVVATSLLGQGRRRDFSGLDAGDLSRSRRPSGSAGRGSSACTV